MGRQPLKLTTAATLLTAGAVLVPPAGPASASVTSAEGRGASPTVQVLTEDVVAPLKLAVHEGQIYVGDAARSTLSKLGTSAPIATGPQPGEIAGVDVEPSGKAVAYAAMDRRTDKGTVTILRPGKTAVVADVSGFEREKNPDGALFYGARTSDPCVRDALAKLPLPTPRPANYQGVVESHPYAVAADGRGGWYVADASANDVLRVNEAGEVSLVAVLPPQPHTFTAKDAKALDLPSCIVGVRYAFESVPTDVEVDSDGALYVSTMTGGPLDLRLGARGGVYRVDPATGTTKQVVTGFGGAVDLALGRNGQIYVAELYSGQISVVDRGRSGAVAKPLVKLPYVVAVEFDGGSLYASTLSPDYLEGKTTGHGSVVKIG